MRKCFCLCPFIRATQGAKDSPVDFRGHGRLTETDVLKFVLQQINNAAKKEYTVNNNKDEL